jgi:hypothetical protein
MRRSLACVLATGLLLAACGGGDDDASDDDDGEIAGVEVVRVPPYVHTEAPVEYDRHPPVGGDHGSEALPCGFYTEQADDKVLVHDLEHGVVWLAYAPDLAEDDLAELERLVDEYGTVIAMPYGGLDTGVAVVATSWGRQLTLDSVDDPRLEQFVERFRQSDAAPERRIGC